MISGGVCQRQARITSCFTRNSLGLLKMLHHSVWTQVPPRGNALPMRSTSFPNRPSCSIWFGMHPSERHSIVFPAFANLQRFKMYSWLTIRRFFWLSMISSRSTMSWFRSNTCPRSWRFASRRRLSCSSFFMFWKVVFLVSTPPSWQTTSDQCTHFLIKLLVELINAHVQRPNVFGMLDLKVRLFGNVFPD